MFLIAHSHILNRKHMNKYIQEAAFSQLVELFRRATDEHAPETVQVSAICDLIHIKEIALADEEYEALYDFHNLEVEYGLMLNPEPY